MDLNQLASQTCEKIISDAQRLRVQVHKRPDGGQTIDMGIHSPGGLRAGIALSEVCMASLGRASLVPATLPGATGVAVGVMTDHPVGACMAAQYAGWEIRTDGYFAMGSGPMRAAAGREELFDHIGFKESPPSVVGVLETRTLPPKDVVHEIAARCRVAPADVTLLVAPTASQAGTLQIAARSVETALHKLHTLGFDVTQVACGYGTAPLPPVAADDLTAVGWTNDAILYGGEVTLWVTADDPLLAEIGPRLPSEASADYGRPFAEIFARYNGDFYKIDPHLFSPAVVRMVNLSTGRSHAFGHTAPEILAESISTLGRRSKS